MKLQPCWLKYPTYHYKYKMEMVSGRVKLMTMKLDVWRTALSLEGHYVLLVSLTQTLGADCLKGGITHVGCQRGSYHISIPTFQFGTLTLTHSTPCPSSTLLLALHSLHSLVLFMETAVTSIRLKVIIMSYSCLWAQCLP